MHQMTIMGSGRLSSRITSRGELKGIVAACVYKNGNIGWMTYAGSSPHTLLGALEMVKYRLEKVLAE